MAKITNIDRPTDAAFLLFHIAEEIDGITKVQKLLFLIEQETEFGRKYADQVTFEFKPYKMGPFSPEVYKQVELLLSMNALEAKSGEMSPSEGFEIKQWAPDSGSEGLAHKRFVTTEKGHVIGESLVDLLDDEMVEELVEVIEYYNSMPLRQLLEYVYTNYEEMTKESEIKEEVLGD